MALAAQLEGWQADLRLPVTPCDEVKNLATSMKIATELWRCVDDDEQAAGSRADLPLALIDPAEIEAAVLRYTRALSQAERGLPSNTVLPRLRERTELCKAMLPVVVALRNPSLKPWHYDALERELSAAIAAEVRRRRAATAQHSPTALTRPPRAPF